MKHFYLWSLILLMGFNLIGCSEDNTPSPNNNNGNNDNTEEIIKENIDTINFAVLIDGIEHTECVPRMIFSYGNWTGIEMKSPDNNMEYAVLQFINVTEGQRVLVTFNQNSATFLDYDPLTHTAGNEICSIYEKNDNIYCSIINVNWETNEHTIISTSSYPLNTEQKRNKSRYMDNYEEEMKAEFYNFFARIGDGISILGTVLPAPVKMVCDVWTKAAIPASQYMLYSDNPEKLQEISNALLIEEAIDQILSINISFIPTLKKIYQTCYVGYKTTLLYKYFHPENSDEYIFPGFSESEMTQSYNYMDRFSSQMDEIKNLVYEEADKFDVSITVSNITENSAEIKGDFNIVSGVIGYVSEYGYKYSEVNGTFERTITVESFPNRTVLQDLEPGTTYEVTAYLKSMGMEYKSSPQQFTTESSFELTPNTLSFGEEGGESEIKITLPSDNWKWEIASKPEWCEVISQSAESFKIKVMPFDDNNKEQRSGTILVKCTSINGNTLEKQIPVEQFIAKNSWDNTSWLFKGDIINKGKGQEISIKTEFVLNVISIENNRYSIRNIEPLTEDISIQLRCNEKNQLIWEYKENISDETSVGYYDFLIVFEMIDANNAKSTITGEAVINDSELGKITSEVNGVLTGTRIK